MEGLPSLGFPTLIGDPALDRRPGGLKDWNVATAPAVAEGSVPDEARCHTDVSNGWQAQR